MAEVLRVQRWSEMGEADRRALMERGMDDIFDVDLGRQITELIDDVRVNGDDAVCRALATFDRVQITPERLRVSDDEFAAARNQVPGTLVDALSDAITHLRAFSREVLARHGRWRFESEPGLMVGEQVSAISSAGLFCPSGKASYPSVLAQLGTPAVEAGVPTIAVVVPPVPGGDGEVDPAVLVVADLLGLRNVFRVNGPAGVAALSFGTASIPKVVKIVGPGSPPVVRAQVEAQRHGTATMMLLGPTESLVLADSSADPVRLAADLLVEAEHGTDTTVVLVTDSSSLIEQTDAELVRQIVSLRPARREAALAALGTNGGAVLVDSIDTAVAVANEFAPEHLQLVVHHDVEEQLLSRLVNAGEILIGQHTSFSSANFIIGCPASLPTSGFAHVSSGITVDAFLKRTAIARADERAMRRMAPSVIALADHEGFPAHGNAARVRLGLDLAQ
ncbi:MAG: histidinol dehydrogenase [Acidimicrobiia bacterium]